MVALVPEKWHGPEFTWGPWDPYSLTYMVEVTKRQLTAYGVLYGPCGYFIMFIIVLLLEVTEGYVFRRSRRREGEGEERLRSMRRTFMPGFTQA